MGWIDLNFIFMLLYYLYRTGNTCSLNFLVKILVKSWEGAFFSLLLLLFVVTAYRCGGQRAMCGVSSFLLARVSKGHTQVTSLSHKHIYCWRILSPHICFCKQIFDHRFTVLCGQDIVRLSFLFITPFSVVGFFFWDRSLCSTGSLGILHVDQAGLELKSTCQILGLKAYSTTLGFISVFSDAYFLGKLYIILGLKVFIDVN